MPYARSMRLELDGQYLDYDLDMFAGIAHAISNQVRRMWDSDSDMSDTLDYPEAIEHWLGVGFAAAQVYLTSAMQYHKTSQRPRRDVALDLGPTLPSGMAVARIVNHGANFWKHAGEWDCDVLDARRKAIERAFGTVGLGDDDWRLYRLVMLLTGADWPDLTLLSPLLEQWRTALCEVFPESEWKSREGGERDESRSR